MAAALALLHPNVLAQWHSWNMCVCHKRPLCNATGWHGWSDVALRHYTDLAPKVRRYYETPPPDDLQRLQAVSGSASEAQRLASLPWPHKIHQTWKTHRLPEGMRQLASSWRLVHPQWEYKLWNDEENRRFIAREYSWFLPTYDGYDHAIKRVDAVRVFYLHKHGGVYADLDSIALQSLESLLGEQFPRASVLLGFVGRGTGFQPSYSENVPNALMVSKPGAPFWLDVMRELVRRRNCAKPEYDTGPGLITDVAKRHAVVVSRRGVPATAQTPGAVVVLNSSYFYPIDWASKLWKRVPYENRRRVLANMSQLAHTPSDLATRIAHASNSRLDGAYVANLWMHTWQS